MLLAELHGKVGADARVADERSEDVLTSHVFGALRYLPDDTVLRNWFRKARGIDAHDALLIAEDVEQVGVDLWRRFPSGREIDAVLVGTTRAGAMDVLGIECKYLSGKSETDDADDQLAHYYHQLVAVFPAARSVRLVYVTSHAALPRSELEKTLRFCPGVDARSSFAWLSWRALPPVLEQRLNVETDIGRRNLLADLRDVLGRRGFRSYAGLTGLHAPMLPSSSSWRQRWLLGRRPAVPSSQPWFRGSPEQAK
jgi:hypothetical protein